MTRKQNLLSLFISTLLLLQSTMLPVMAQQEPDSVADLLAGLTVAEKVGQLFIVPFVGNNTDADADISMLLTEYKVGGVVLQASNGNFNNNSNTPQQIAGLTNKLQSQTLANKNIPLFIAIDQEGDGWPYTRITGGVTPIPSPMSIGATWDVNNARDIGQIVGQELSAMGINMLLGPVLDVLNDPHPTGRGDMGTRTFGGDPFWVGAMGTAYIQGVHQGSNNTIVTVAKHFPGHGGSDRLPDNEVATVDKSLQELKRIELAPFFAVTQPDTPGTTDALMSSHIRYRGFQGDIRQFTAPISFDAAGMSTLLALPEFASWREAGGLIVSDALGVPAVRKHYDPTLQTFPHRRIAREAFLAGNDLLILAQFDLNSIWSQQFENIKDTLDYFQTEYRNNSDFAAHVDEAVTRILRLKLKLFPNPGPNALFVDGEVALAVSGRGGQVVNRITRQSLTLLYPTPEEYQQRLPRSPAVTEKILIVSDTRLVRECFQENCDPFQALPVDALESLALQFYGPDTTQQIRPENITSITFTELKQVLVGSLAQSDEAPPESVAALITHSPEEITTLIQEADWIIFAALDLNTDRYPASDALKLFLAQGVSSLYDKKLIVFALNSPYYLDTTEINKLTAYFGLYSKTEPHLETAVKALYGEAAIEGASPVSVDSIGYDLVSVLAPDPVRSFPVQVKTITPDSLEPPVEVTVQAGPVLDSNGHPVPDGTPVEFKVAYNTGQSVSVPMTTTVNGLASVKFTLRQSGSVQIFADSGQATSRQPQIVTVAPLPQKPTATPTSSPTPNPTDTPAIDTSQTSSAAAITPTTEQLSPTSTATQTAPALAETGPLSPIQLHKNVTQIDFWAAIGAIFLAAIAGLLLWQKTCRSFPQRIRLGLVIFIGGMTAYLLYGIGWLRPDLWISATVSELIQHITLFGLVLVFGLIAGLAAQRVKW